MKPVNDLSHHDRPKPQSSVAASVYVIDDDAVVRDQLLRLLHGLGYDVHTFASLREFSRHRRCDEVACLVMEFHLSRPYRLEQPSRRAHLFGNCPPVVFTAVQADVSSAVRAIKLGAIDFLLKPLDEAEVLAAIRQGIGEDRDLRAAEARRNDVRRRFAGLTPRERQVLGLVAQGRLSKQIAGDLGLSVNTIKMHRSNAMRRMAVPTRAALISLLDELGHGSGRAYDSRTLLTGWTQG